MTTTFRKCFFGRCSRPARPKSLKCFFHRKKGFCRGHDVAIEPCRSQAYKNNACIAHGGRSALCLAPGCITVERVGGFCYRHQFKAKPYIRSSKPTTNLSKRKVERRATKTRAMEDEDLDSTVEGDLCHLVALVFSGQVLTAWPDALDKGFAMMTVDEFFMDVA
ncbi:Aste57867_10990 [Aphanomyces stellatus]|uniref:Aste57867_10990 protein n=1 Tax=Aphanomyces stellatus TaxID=120398 RepID=A0A485KSB4_9STRA|nr:hypothetical protein As57867_010949 [Aphanomyces stellatus]VFT87858.1 Aste57867_10990 [Aphanomyces stellatus]